MRKYFVLLLSVFFVLNVQGQMIKKIPFDKENSVYKLTYELPEIASSYDVILTSNYPTGRGFVKVTENALGDIGQNISSGKNKTIYWQPKKDVVVNEAALEFKIVMIPLATAEVIENEPIIIKMPEEVIAKRKEEAKAEANNSESNSDNNSNSNSDNNAESTPTTIDFGSDEGKVGDPISVEQEIKNVSGAGAKVPGRTVRSKPKSPSNPGLNGTVVVKVCVDVNGKVVKAKFLPESSTVTNDIVIGQAVANARKWKFNENSMAADRQCGTITYYYKVK